MLTSGWKLRHQWVRNGAAPPAFSVHSSSFFQPVQGCAGQGPGGASWFPRETAQRDSADDSSSQVVHLVQFSLLG